MQTFAIVVSVLVVLAFALTLAGVALWLSLTANGRNPFQ